MRDKSYRSLDEGFTLIELLIVIIVLGILTAIVLLGLGTFKRDGQLATCRSDTKNLRTAETAYLTKHLGGSADVAALVDGGYLQSAPDSDADGTATALDVSASPNGTITVTPPCL